MKPEDLDRLEQLRKTADFPRPQATWSHEVQAWNDAQDAYHRELHAHAEQLLRLARCGMHAQTPDWGDLMTEAELLQLHDRLRHAIDYDIRLAADRLIYTARLGVRAAHAAIVEEALQRRFGCVG